MTGYKAGARAQSSLGPIPSIPLDLVGSRLVRAVKTSRSVIFMKSKLVVCFCELNSVGTKTDAGLE